MITRIVEDVKRKVSTRKRAPTRVRWPQTTAIARPRPDSLNLQSAKIDAVLDESFPASDPPSWNGAISRVAASPAVSRRVTEGLLRRARAEYQEMPGLCLTLEQAQRLWSLERRTCEALLELLVRSRFLRRTEGGLFILQAAQA